jgi:VCBS repeat-containing protein
VGDLLTNWSTTVGGRLVPTNSDPGADDTAVFDGKESTTNCVVRLQDVQVKAVIVRNDYSGRIILEKSLSVSDTAGTTVSAFNAPVTIKGKGGALVLGGNTSLVWWNGSFQNLLVDVRRDGANSGTLVVNDDGHSAARRMSDTTLHISGTLDWKNGDVPTFGSSAIQVEQGGKFNVSVSTSGTWGNDPTHLSVTSIKGQLLVGIGVTATINGNYTSVDGETKVWGGTLRLGGTAVQAGKDSSFQLIAEGKVILSSQGGTLNICDGQIIGSGTVQGSLILGNDPAVAGYDPATNGITKPVISPGNNNVRIGSIKVVGNFRMFSGEMHIEIKSGNVYDVVAVTGTTVLRGAGPGGTVEGNLLDANEEIDPANFIFFLTRGVNPNVNTDFQTKILPKPQANWEYGIAADMAWFKPKVVIEEKKGKVGGNVWLDNGALAGVREAGEGAPPGVGVQLLDEAGNPVAAAVADAAGAFLFDNVPAGIFFVQFAPLAGMRLVAANVGDPGTDSDPDPDTGLVRVEVYGDRTDIDAGYRYNAAPVVVDGDYRGHTDGALVGNVLAGATDADGDALTALLGFGPLHGVLVLNTDGSFDYTADAGYTGTDAFTVEADDDHGGTTTGTVNITVANTAAPVGAGDSYSAPADALEVDAAGGVLANDTDQGNGTLTAVLATGPAHGTLALSPDGSFTYTPDEDFVGTDTFTYRPTDDDGPGNLTTVSIAVTDHPPRAEDDTATTNEDTPVAVSVLTNDTDADSDTPTVLGASDGLFGTTVVNADGTITYTPDANWNGTDTFVYVIGDGHGRLAFGTATVTVDPVNDAPVATDAAVMTPQNTATDIDLRTLVTDVETAPEDLTFAVSGAVNGTVALLSDGHTARFTPNPWYHGPASFTYTTTDTGDGASPALTSAAATVTVSVNSGPTAADVTGSLHAGGSVMPPLAWTDPDGDMATITAFTAETAHGWVRAGMMGMGLVYTAKTPTYTGTDAFTYTISDGHGGFSTGTVTLALTNTPPTASSFDMYIHAGGSLGAIPMYFDADYDAVTLTGFTQGQHGSVAQVPMGTTLTYQADSPSYVGDDYFDYTVDDGHGGTATGRVTIHLTNAPPTASDVSMWDSGGLPVAVSVMASDPDWDTVTIAAVSDLLSGSGSVSLSNGSIVYTPPNGYSGVVTFTYTVSDGHGGTATATATITVTAKQHRAGWAPRSPARVPHPSHLPKSPPRRTCG